MTASGLSREVRVIDLGGRLKREAVEPKVKLGFTVVGIVDLAVDLVVVKGREGDYGGNSVKEGSGGSGGFGGSPPGVDENGFRTEARPSEESQQFASEDIF